MDTLEKQVLERLAQENTVLRVNNIELELRLVQALQTINALEKEGKPDGNVEQQKADDRTTTSSK